jgi:DNA-binding transcriptional regulator YhcF (GntR family)
MTPHRLVATGLTQVALEMMYYWSWYKSATPERRNGIMFDRKRQLRGGLSQDVLFSLDRARNDAGEMRHDYLGTEHILLGLLQDGMVADILGRFGVKDHQVRAAVHTSVRPGKAGLQRSELPYTSRAKKVLEFAFAEARREGETICTPRHVLIGLLLEEKGIAAEVLNSLGLTLDGVRSTRVTNGYQREASRFRVIIDDTAARSIYEQIVGQITEAVATGAVQPGERLPTVRHLADELDVAPGTVARAYTELEGKGLVVTEGPRGTRVTERLKKSKPKLDKPGTLAGLLRPVAVAAFHLGASAKDLRAALEEAMQGIFDRPDAVKDSPTGPEDSLEVDT